jgi:hypothetical protein
MSITVMMAFISKSESYYLSSIDIQFKTTVHFNRCEIKINLHVVLETNSPAICSEALINCLMPAIQNRSSLSDPLSP